MMPVVDTSLQTDTPRQNPLVEENEVRTEEIGSSTNIETPYERLSLGLLMTLVFRLCGNIRTAAITAISCTILVGSFDTSSDMFLCLFYLSQGLTTLAVLVLLCDYFPGLVVLAHHVTSNSWQISTTKEKLFPQYIIYFFLIMSVK